MVGALRRFYREMKPRSKKDVQVLPQSAMNVLLAVRRIHKAHGYKMAPMHQVNAALRGMMRRHAELYTEESLQPKRKEPFTRAILGRLTTIPNGLDLGGQQHLCWEDRRGRAIFALICTLSECGFRKGEVAGDRCAKRSHLTWRIGGRMVANPTSEQLNRLAAGDMAILKPPPSKADQFGLIWAANPIYLGYDSRPRNACRALAAMVTRAPITDEQLSSTALFAEAADGQPFKPSRLDTILRRMLLTFMSPAVAATYSWHSFRIYLACALLATNTPTARILALCRWLTERSLHIYARLTESVSIADVQRAMCADFVTIRSQNIAAHLQTAQPEAIVDGSGGTHRIDFDLGMEQSESRELQELLQHSTSED